MAAHSKSSTVSSEDLAYWYLRLNGFLTTKNFVVHPDTGSNQRTDVDILGVRFPHRAELLLNPMKDDTPFTEITDKPYIIIAEVKSGTCDLNGPWTDRLHQNMDRVLRAVGAFDDSQSTNVAQSLYSTGTYLDKRYYVSLSCFGKYQNKALRTRYPTVPQKTWDEVLKFIFKRFNEYREQKASHPQWDDVGKQLYNMAVSTGERIRDSSAAP